MNSSFTLKNNNSKKKLKKGWNDIKRMNLGISRKRISLIVIGNMKIEKKRQGLANFYKH